MAHQTPDQTQLTCRCDMGVLNDREQERHQTISLQIQKSVESVRELPDGYALRFAAESDLILALAEFITLERRCCDFFNFRLEVEADGPMWLRMTGGAGVKEFLEGELGLQA